MDHAAAFAQANPSSGSVPLLGSLVCVGVTSLLLFVFFVWTLIWIYRDAEARGGEALLWLALSLFFWPLPLIVWLFVRPPRKPAAAEA